jgi:hypothetical protein
MEVLIEVQVAARAPTSRTEVLPLEAVVTARAVAVRAPEVAEVAFEAQAAVQEVRGAVFEALEVLPLRVLPVAVDLQVDEAVAYDNRPKS